MVWLIRQTSGSSGEWTERRTRKPGNSDGCADTGPDKLAVVPRPLLGLTPDDCPFCDIAAERIDNGVIAFRNESALAFPSRHQRSANLGHLLVAPARHVPDVYRLPTEVASDLFCAVSVVARATRAAFGADGVTVLQHNELAGGQDVFHMHVHVIPRFADDGFYQGAERYPHGMVDLPIEERLQHAEAVRQHLSADNPPHPNHVHGSTEPS